MINTKVYFTDQILVQTKHRECQYFAQDICKTQTNHKQEFIPHFTLIFTFKLTDDGWV